MSESLKETIAVSSYMLDMLDESLAKSAAPAPPPPGAVPPAGAPADGASLQADGATTVVGEPLPADMVQQGASAMEPPPGAATTGAAGPPADPAMQMVEMLGQVGSLTEQGLSAIVPLLQAIVDVGERIEKQLILLSGAAIGGEAQTMATQMASPAPKTASATQLPGDEIPARGRDGEISQNLTSDLRDTIRHCNTMADAILLVRKS